MTQTEAVRHQARRDTPSGETVAAVLVALVAATATGVLLILAIIGLISFWWALLPFATLWAVCCLIGLALYAYGFILVSSGRLEADDA